MIEHELDIQTPDGEMNTFITYPEDGGPFPMVLFLMDAMGKREELYDMARRLATAGYYVLLPKDIGKGCWRCMDELCRRVISFK